MLKLRAYFILTAVLTSYPAFAGDWLDCSELLVKQSLKLGGYHDALQVDFSAIDFDPTRSVHSTDTRYLEDVIWVDREEAFPQRNMRLGEKTDRYWVDGDYFAHNYFRRRIYQEEPDTVFQVAKGAEEKMQTAGKELLEHLAAELPKLFPDMFKRKGNQLYNLQSQEVWRLDAADIHPMALAGLIVNEDLVLVDENRKGEFEMVGGFLANPSSWDLERHLGNNLEAIHEGEDPKLISAIEKSTRNLKEKDKVIIRNNWSLTDNPAYGHYPYNDGAYHSSGRIMRKNIGEKVILRSEYESLSLLPRSGLVLFTIKVFQYPLETAASIPSVNQGLQTGVELNNQQEHYEFPHPNLVLEYLQKTAED